jgi:anti-sigma B factor antagonist
MLKVHFQESERGLIAAPLTARLDASVALELRDALVGPARAHAAVVVDLVHVATMDASGLAALVSVMKAMRPGAELWVANAKPPVRALLARTGMDRVLRLLDGAGNPVLV